jgi:uncharacterized phage-associated protein
MIPAIDVARYLIHLAAPTEDEDADCLTHLRLQKLLYYVQAWHLAGQDKPFFTGRIEAWAKGPVVRPVYSAFGNRGCIPFPVSEGIEPASLSAKDKAFVRSVWDEYKQYSPTALTALTHREAPWKDTYTAFAGPDGRCSAEITHDAMRAYFTPRLRERLLRSDSRFDPVLLDKTLAAVREGRFRSVQEIRRELHHRRTGTNAG